MVVDMSPPPFMIRFMKQHHWYVELVVRSKCMEFLGREPTTEEFKEHGARLLYPSGMECLTWDGMPLIEYSGPRFDETTNKLIMDYRR